MPAPDQAASQCLSPKDRANAVENVTKPPAPLAGVRILFAEDSTDNQVLIAHHLRKAGAAVCIVFNGREAAELLTSNHHPDGELISPSPFDLLISDMQMPELDGYALARLLRAKGSTMPILALTAHAMAGEMETCLAAGCHAFASKPINRDSLIALCTTTVQRNRPVDGNSRSAPIHEAGFRSEHANDPEMMQIVDKFLGSLQTKLTTIQAMLEQKNLVDLARIAHQLKGSGGGYGYPEITRHAAVVESIAKLGSATPRLDESVDQLIAFCQNAIRYRANRPKPNEV